MGNCCLKPQYQTLQPDESKSDSERDTDIEKESSQVQIESYKETSDIYKKVINEESSKASSLTAEERERWVESQCSNPDEKDLYSK